MSIKQVRNALESFASDRHSGAIVLKGEWGTGKTFFWRSVVKQKKESFAKSHYSYVSLFGINSLKDLKRSIFENKVSKFKADVASDYDSLSENINALKLKAPGFFKRASSHAAELSVFGVKGFGSVIESMQFFKVTDTLICIDDFERKGCNLSDRDVLGLISNIVETKQCTVLLILNQESLAKGSEYFSFNEKVFDYEILFQPTAAEAASIVFDGQDAVTGFIVENVISLNISNIRLLRKIKFFSEVLLGSLMDCPVEIKRQVMSVLPLSIYALYGGSSQISICDVESAGSGYGHFFDSDTASAEDLSKKKLKDKADEFLHSYGFHNCDELDFAIIELVKRGYADESKINQIIDVYKAKIKHDGETALISKAWRVFQDSFADNKDEVMTAFEESIAVCLERMSISDLDSIVWMFEVLDEQARGAEVVELYFDALYRKKSLTNKEDIFRWPESEVIQKKLDGYFDCIESEKNLSEMLDLSAVDKHIRIEFLMKLKQCSVEEFRDYFKSLKGNDLVNNIRMCLRLNSYVSGEEDHVRAYNDVFVKSYEAILMIGEESFINKARVKKFVRDYDLAYRERVRRCS